MIKLLTLFFFIFLTATALQAKEREYKELKKEYDELLNKKFILLPHKGTYFLPFVYNSNPNQKPYKPFTQLESDDEDKKDRGKFNDYLETEFQVSFLLLTGDKIFDTNFDSFFGFTNKSFWQLYNEQWSRPFRETNYAPEFFIRYDFDSPPKFLNSELIYYDIGLVHESNGQIQELSRSWNRLFVRFSFYTESYSLGLMLWHRFYEPGASDDNPRIYKFKGYGEFDFAYRREDLEFQVKLLPGTKHLGREFSVSYPFKEGLRGYVKASYGYGLSLLDYDHDNQKIGIGVILKDLTQ